MRLDFRFGKYTIFVFRFLDTNLSIVYLSFATSCEEYSRMVLVCSNISSLPPLEKISAFYQEGKLCKLFLLHPKLRTKNLVPTHFRIRIECRSLFHFETWLSLQQSFYIFFSRIALLLAFSSIARILQISILHIYVVSCVYLHFLVWIWVVGILPMHLLATKIVSFLAQVVVLLFFPKDVWVG